MMYLEIEYDSTFVAAAIIWTEKDGDYGCEEICKGDDGLDTTTPYHTAPERRESS